MKRTFATLTLIAGMITGSANAAVIGQLGILEDTANGGINPATGEAWKAGDTYRLIFITSTTTTAASTNIADYNTFVQTAATNANAAYGTVDWFAVGSTATVTAIANTGTTGTGVGIFDFVSEKIVDSYTDLWDGNIDRTINYTELGGVIADTQYWTGTDSDGEYAADGETAGFPGTGRVLGGSTEAAASVQVGRNRTDMTNARWMRQFSDTGFATNSRSMLAISEELTVVPEPGSLALLGLGGLLIGARRRRG